MTNNAKPQGQGCRTACLDKNYGRSMSLNATRKLFAPGSFPTLLLILGLSLIMQACASKQVQVERERFFFPPAPETPRIEYIKPYFSDMDLHGKQDGFMSQYVLGEKPPANLFAGPTDVVSDGKGRVFVTDTTRRQVVILDLNRLESRLLNQARETGTGQEALLSVPYSVDIDDQGRLYVVDPFLKKIVIFGPDEVYQRTIELPEIGRPTSIALDSAHGRIMVADTSLHQLVVVTTEGIVIGTIGERGNGPSQFNYPTDVDVDEQGNVYVLDTLNARVQMFNPELEFVREFGERGTAAGSFRVPKMLAVDPFGHIYVTEALDHKIVIFNREGDFLLRVGGKSMVTNGVSPGGFYLPRGIDVDQNGTIWVVDSLNRMIHRFQFLTPEYLAEHPVE
ncbi:MAG: hypothetical protein C0614_02650 [Desulfuromonas sp.]|nr:MAG: hypothetical protein C0614_02650 [Desulfuromonas sp.]